MNACFSFKLLFSSSTWLKKQLRFKIIYVLSMTSFRVGLCEVLQTITHSFNSLREKSFMTIYLPFQTKQFNLNLKRKVYVKRQQVLVLPVIEMMQLLWRALRRQSGLWHRFQCVSICITLYLQWTKSPYPKAMSELCMCVWVFERERVNEWIYKACWYYAEQPLFEFGWQL